MFNPAKVSKNIKKEFIEYVTTTLEFPKNPKTGKSEMGDKFKEQLNKVIAKGPFIDLNCTFKKGKTINELINEYDQIGNTILSPLFRDLEASKDNKAGYKKEFPLDRPLYLHQEKSIRLIHDKNNAIITTGTGSGKTECFLYPLIDSLLREKENNTLDDSVRAILIYPMNALANDQMKRLRKILMFYPDITFGVYNGDTPYRTGEIQDYIDLHVNEKYEELRTPLPNERLTREDFTNKPPHILCTNYAMLEYMLLTPNRGAVLDNSKVKFIVLDEAHTYSGATGMETSLLIRRLLAKINQSSVPPQYILTSATLGEQGKSDNDIVNFANNLTGGKFDTSCIIYSERDLKMNDLKGNDYPITVFNELADSDESEIVNIFANNNIDYDSNLTYEENIYNLCYDSYFYKVLRENYTNPVEIRTISNWLNISIDDTVNFLHICTLGNKNNTALIELRYHFFVRALEGLYYSFCFDHSMYLERKEEVDGNKVFEISICKNCGDIAIVGHIENINGIHYLVSREKSLFASVSNEDNSTYFHIINDPNDIETEDVEYDEANEEDSDMDDDDLALQKEKQLTEIKNTNTFWLCPHCGELSIISDGYPTCYHSKNDIMKVRAYDKKVRTNKSKCLYCQHGNYNRFYIGTESATSVLCSALFQQLPLKKVVQQNAYGQDEIKIAGKQFLSFSDSRSEAAYFASYVDQRYENLISKRVVANLITKEEKKIKEDEWNLDDFASELQKYFVKEKTFHADLLEEQDLKELKKISLKKAWSIILKELITCRRNESLQSMGILKFEYAGNEDETVKFYQSKYFPNLTLNETKALLDELAMTFAYFGAIIIPEDAKFDIGEINKIYFTYHQKAIAEKKSTCQEPYIGNWLPMAMKTDPNKYYKTYRLNLILNALNDETKINEAIVFLSDYFKFITNPRTKHGAISIGTGKQEFAMPTDRFNVIIEGMNNCKWYRCDKCGKITTFNFKNNCTISKCNGKLEEIQDLNLLLKDNYYYDFYKSNDPYLKKMIIKEHTAQLSKKDAANYQIEFERNNINALSCSTTFEMGVDVGELETVLLRDMPPSAANYAQRAGRAGRSRNSAAFVISYAKLSSHDFNYYENPIEMINGKIVPPSFKLDNKKIYYRHIYSTLFGYFFNTYPDYFEDSTTGTQRSIAHFVENGYPEFIKMIKTPPKDLVVLIKRAFEDLPDVFDGNNFSIEWIDDLIGSDGRLTNAVKDYEDTITDFETQIENVYKNKPSKWADIIGKIGRKEDWYKDTKIIRFLVNANILPKYGFPVDSVELKIGSDDIYNQKNNDGLRLNRDMTQAISDYAPGCKVIANDRMYTSRYISKYWKNGKKDFDKVYITECQKCNTLNVSQIKEPLSFNCVGCNHDLTKCANWLEAITPTAGMISDGEKGEPVPLTRPKRIYRSDYYFVEEDKNANQVILDIGTEKITLISSKYDTIGVTSSTKAPFYICDFCGFAYGNFDKIKYKKGSSYLLDTVAMNSMRIGKPTIKPIDSHLKPNGEPCACQILKKRVLCHSFKTDIVQILFNNVFFTSYDEAISILYSLIDSMANVLSIERSEISGTISSEFGNTNTNYKFILFDNVPGGAGHVKRILDNNYKNLYDVISYAYDKTINCDCDCNASCYKCLRTYENQKYHENLSRKYVYDFLKKYYHINPIVHKIANIKVSGGNKYPYSNFADFFNIISTGFDKYFMDFMINENINLPDLIYCDISIDGIQFSSKPAFYWKKANVFVFSLTDSSVIEKEKNADDYNFFVADSNFNKVKFKNKIQGGK